MAMWLIRLDADAAAAFDARDARAAIELTEHLTAQGFVIDNLETLSAVTTIVDVEPEEKPEAGIDAQISNAQIDDADKGVNNLQVLFTPEQSRVLFTPEQSPTFVPTAIPEIAQERRVVRDEWPHVRVFSDLDPTAAVLAYEWPVREDPRTKVDLLLAFAQRVDDGQSNLRETQIALAMIIRVLASERGR